MKTAKLGALLKWEGQEVKVVGIAEGKTIIMEPVGARPCNGCGYTEQYHILEHSPLFQENAEPILTLETN